MKTINLPNVFIPASARVEWTKVTLEVWSDTVEEPKETARETASGPDEGAFLPPGQGEALVIWWAPPRGRTAEESVAQTKGWVHHLCS